MPERVVLLGHPVSHSLSPVLQHAAFAAAGLPWTYGLLDVTPADLGSTLARLEEDLSVVGANVTVPHKQEACSWLARCNRFLSEPAKRLGAVNVLRRGEDGFWQGHTTDFEGFTDGMHRVLGASDAARAMQLPAVILGAGGSARTLAGGLLAHPEGSCRVMVLARDPHKAKASLRDLPGDRLEVCALESFGSLATAEPMLVIQATTVGMRGGPDPLGSPVDLGTLHKESVACDIVYRPVNTPFLQAAASRGVCTVNGLGMLAGQGARALALWTENRMARPRIDIFETMDAMIGALSRADLA